MGRTIDEIIAELPADERAAVDSRYQVLKQEGEGLLEARPFSEALLGWAIALTEGMTVDLDAEIEGDVSI